MADEHPDFPVADVTEQRPSTSGDRLTLLVAGNGTLVTHPLPASGKITIGRGQGADVRVDDAAVSRQHAILYVGQRLMLEDLGSANGTLVREKQLAPKESTELSPGDAIQMGSTTLIVQRASATLRPRRLSSHSYFEMRVEEECARAEQSGGCFAMVRLSVGSKLSSGTAQQIFSDELRSTDIIGTYGPTGEYEVLLIDTLAEAAEETLRRIEQAFTRAGAQVQMGLAVYGRDSRTPEGIIAKACARVRGAVEEGEPPKIVVEDPAMHRLYQLIERVALGNISMLLLGETGVGKEIVAEQIHRQSKRAGKPLVRLNCAALNEALLESELFGHERGAFTGAVQTKRGLLETADGGTVFLDEVGELPPNLQAKLLRVIEDGVLQRVGSVAPKNVDIRVVAATNRDLEQAVTSGAFRRDLYFRLAGVSIVIPPLRERRAELAPLAELFMRMTCEREKMSRPPAVSKEAMDCLKRYSWPGNLRELRNTMERAVLLAGEGPILPEHLPLEKMAAAVSPVIQHAAPLPLAAATQVAPDDVTENLDTVSLPATSLRDQRVEAERQAILDALKRCGGNQTRAASELGISRRTLINRLEAYGIARPRKR